MPLRRSQKEGLGEGNMTEEEKRRFESLETLRVAAYTSFNDRRGYEWKLALSIWTALAIFLAGLVQPAKTGEAFPLHGPCVWVAFAVAGLVVVILHSFWSNWASRAHYIDNKIQYHFRDEMINNGVKLPLSQELVTFIACHLQREPTHGWTQRSHLVQVGITALLVLAVVVTVYARTT